MAKKIEIVEMEEESVVVQTGLTAEVREKLGSYLAGEILDEAGGASRADFLEDVKKWRRQRLAKPANKTKDYPFPGSANLCPPLTMNKVNTIFAKALAVYSMKRPFWSCSASDPKLNDHADALARLMNKMCTSPFQIGFAPKQRRTLYDAISLGFQFYEWSWDREVVRVGVSDVTLKDGPTLNLYRVEDLVIRSYFEDLQTAPWFALRIRKSWAEIAQKGKSGEWTDVERIKGFNLGQLPEAEAADLEGQGLSTEIMQTSNEAENIYDLYRFWCRYMVDGEFVDLVGIIEPESGVVLRVDYNPVAWRFVGKIGYQDIPGWVYSVGVCKQVELLQDEKEGIRNQRSDDLSWSMMGMYKARNGSQIKATEKAYPGKIWRVDQMDDFQEMRFDPLIQYSMMAEQAVDRDADAATGANQAMSGQADSTLKSGGGALAQNMLMQQSGTMLNAGFDTMDEYFADMGKLLSVLIVLNGPSVDLSIMGEKDQTLLRELFQVDPNMLPFKFQFEVETTKLERNEQTKKETIATYSAMYTPFVQEIFGLLQMAMQAQDPQMKLVALQFVKGKVALMREITGLLHIGRAGDYLPEFEFIDGAIEQLKAAMGGQSGEGTGGGAAQGAVVVDGQGAGGPAGGGGYEGMEAADAIREANVGGTPLVGL